MIWGLVVMLIYVLLLKMGQPIYDHMMKLMSKARGRYNFRLYLLPFKKSFTVLKCFHFMELFEWILSTSLKFGVNN